MSQIPQSRPRARPKLHIWETARQTYRSVLIENLRFLPRAALAPSLLIIALSFLLQAAGVYYDPTNRQEAEHGIDLVLAELPALIASTLLYLPAVMFIVPWIRLTLFGPQSALPQLNPQWSTAHWRVLGYGIVALSASLALLIVGSFVLEWIPAQAAALDLPEAMYLLLGFAILSGLLALFVYSSAVYVRIMLAIPALLTGLTHPLRDAWQKSRRKNFAIFIALLLVTFPLLIVGFLPFVLSGGGLAELSGEAPYPTFYDTNGPYFPLYVLWNAVLWIFGFAIYSAFIAIAFRTLAEGESESPSVNVNFDSSS